MYIIPMRKYLDVERLTSKVSGPVTEVRATAQSVGRAAESQARLNIALTLLAVAALAVAVLAVREMENRR